MSDEELGRMSYGELEQAQRDLDWNDFRIPEALRQEYFERKRCYREGKPGVSPLLSRRVVAVAESKLVRQLPEKCGATPVARELAQHFRLHCETWNDAIRAYSAFLRGEGEFIDNAPSPLEDES